MKARDVLDQLNLRAAMIAPHYSGLAAALRDFATTDLALEKDEAESRNDTLCSAYGLGVRTLEKPFAFANGVAIIPVHGILINRCSYSYSCVTGYNFIREKYQAALDDDDVKLILLDVNSYGGMVSGCFETSDLIYNGRSVKPSLAIVDASAYSAAYAIASACTKMVAAPSAGVGSIGVVAMHVSMELALKEMGVDVTLIYAGSHKVDGNPFQALPDTVKATIQKSVDKTYNVFVELVSRNRKISTQAVKSTEAECYDADDAVSLGLIDAVQLPSEAVAVYIDELSGSDDDDDDDECDDDSDDDDFDDEGKNMSNATKPGADKNTKPENKEEVAALARASERERIAGITGCSEAEGKAKLANHLALNTDLSAEEAKKILCASASETPSANSIANKFEAAMNNSKHPNIGSAENPSTSEHGQTASRADRIVAAHQAATGIKPRE